MPTEPVSPYAPPSVAPDQIAEKMPSHRFRASLISGLSSIAVGLILVVSMEFTTFDTATVILFTAAFILFALSPVVFFISQRIVSPMFLILPFAAAVVLRHVGEVVPTHFTDGRVFITACILFTVSLVASTVVKLVVAKTRGRSGGGG
ncbi:MAG: hypothetical protein F9B45_16925 [Phycisphaera sp. RhM]|nr:hypothetical protein [Phycisphaera sp. RhM]